MACDNIKELWKIWTEAVLRLNLWYNPMKIKNCSWLFFPLQYAPVSFSSLPNLNQIWGTQR